MDTAGRLDYTLYLIESYGSGLLYALLSKHAVSRPEAIVWKTLWYSHFGAVESGQAFRSCTEVGTSQWAGSVLLLKGGESSSSQATSHWLGPVAQLNGGDRLSPYSSSTSNFHHPSSSSHFLQTASLWPCNPHAASQAQLCSPRSPRRCMPEHTISARDSADP